jgi:hypothetical protein
MATAAPTATSAQLRVQEVIGGGSKITGEIVEVDPVARKQEALFRQIFFIMPMLVGATLTLWTLVMASVAFTLVAHVDVARGKNVGDVATEIQIERTVYISPDWCSDAEIGKTYPAQIDKDHTTIRLRVGQSICKYHITDTRPFLKRTSPGRP